MLGRRMRLRPTPRAFSLSFSCTTILALPSHLDGDDALDARLVIEWRRPDLDRLISRAARDVAPGRRDGNSLDPLPVVLEKKYPALRVRSQDKTNGTCRGGILACAPEPWVDAWARGRVGAWACTCGQRRGVRPSTCGVHAAIETSRTKWYKNLETQTWEPASQPQYHCTMLGAPVDGSTAEWIRVGAGMRGGKGSCIYRLPCVLGGGTHFPAENLPAVRLPPAPDNAVAAAGNHHCGAGRDRVHPVGLAPRSCLPDPRRVRGGQTRCRQNREDHGEKVPEAHLVV